MILLDLIPTKYLWRLGIGLAVLALLGLAKCSYDAALVKADRQRAVIEAAKLERKADDAAGQAIHDAETLVEKEITDARKAASNGDDPLADAFDSLRR